MRSGNVRLNSWGPTKRENVALSNSNETDEFFADSRTANDNAGRKYRIETITSISVASDALTG